MKITLIVSSFLFSFPIPFFPDTRIFVDSRWPSKHVEKNQPNLVTSELHFPKIHENVTSVIYPNHLTFLA